MSQGEKRILIPAGAEGFPVRAAGDFIFLRASATPLRVLIDGQPITMEAGEKRVVKRKYPTLPAFDSFQVDNPADYPQAAVFIVGEGDYEKIIVSGELNVSAYVNSLRGESASLPMPLNRRVSFDPNSERNFTAGNVAQSVTIVEATSGQLGGPWFWDGKYYALCKDNGATTWSVAEISPDGTYNYIPISNGQEKLANSLGINNAVITPWGDIFIIQEVSGTRHRLWKMRQGQWVLIEVKDYFDGNISHSGVGNGKYIDGNLWLIGGRTTADTAAGNNTNCVLLRVDPTTGEVLERRQLIDQNFSNQGGYSLAEINGELFIARPNGSGALKKFDINTGIISTDEFEFDPLPDNAIGDGVAVDPNSLFAAVLVTGTLQIRELQTVTIYGEIIVQNGDDAATAKTVYLREPIRFYVENGTAIISENIAKYILSSFDGVPVENYLDYLVAMEADSGKLIMRRDAGTQSWALRGITDTLKVKSGTDVLLEILPEFFE